MITQLMTEKKVFFEEEVQLTEIREYGFSWQQLTARKAPIPPAGARFDIYFKGKVSGDQINGTVEGVDYLEVRPDGKFSLSLHASIATNDGANIKLIETGLNDQGALRLNMNFHTSDKRYEWLNRALVWGTGDVNFETGTVKIKAYLA